MIQMLRLFKIANTPSSKLNRIESVSDWPEDLPALQRLFFLAEQMLFAKYLLFIEPENKMYLKFKDKCIDSANSTVHLKNEDPTFLKYREKLLRVANGFHNSISWLDYATMLNDSRFDSELKQTTKEFYEPFLFSVTGECISRELEAYGGNNKPVAICSNPVLLYPETYRNLDKVYLNYMSETFTTFFYTKELSYISDNDNPILEHLSRFNWRGKQFGDMLSSLASLSLTSEVNTKNVPSLVNEALSTLGIKQFDRGTTIVNKVLTLGARLHSLYGMSLEDTARIGSFLNQFKDFDSTAINYLIEDRPTVLMQKKFKEYQNLSFLSSTVEARNKPSTFKMGIEATETKLEETEIKDDDAFNVEESDSETDDLDFGDDGLGDDMVDTTDSDFGDFGSDDSESDSEAVAGADEIDTQPEDPTTIALNVLAADPTAEAILFKHRIAASLRNIIQNPPPDLDGSLIPILRTWLTQWLYLVAPSTTRRFLTLLLTK